MSAGYRAAAAGSTVALGPLPSRGGHFLYGEAGIPNDVVGAWMAFNGLELEPLAADLREHLAAIPHA